MKRVLMLKMAVVVGPPVAVLVALVIWATVLSAPAPAGPVEPGPALAASAAYAAGFRGEGLVLAIMVAGAESGYNPAARGENPPNPSSSHPCGRSGSVDRGMWQLNSCYMAYVPDEVAYDPYQAATAVFGASVGGTVWTRWVTFNEGRHLVHEAAARAAASAVSLATAAVVGPNALPLPRHLLNEAMIVDRHWDGGPAWDGAVPPGTPVFAIEAGTVTSVTSGGRCGIGLVVAAAGHTDLYCHGSALNVAAGSTVVAGQQVMVSGSTGERVTGPHLHLEVKVEGRGVCPQQALLAWYRGVAFSPARSSC